MDFNWNASFYFSFNFSFNIEAKIHVRQLLRSVIVCPKIKPASGYWTAVGYWANPPTILKPDSPASPLLLNAMFLVADIHLYNGGREQWLWFFTSSWLAYKRFSCIKIKCIWPIGSIYTITVSKNFRNFSWLKGFKSSTADNWRLRPSFLSL